MWYLFALLCLDSCVSAVRPNIVVIVADDQGYANIGYHNDTVLTPRIDALAKEGVILERYYVQPVCSPTRSSLMTGRYTYRLGTQATVIRADTPFGVPLEETFLSQNLRDAGYATALYGKWHLGFYQRAYTPLERGFDKHLGYFQGTVDYYTHIGGGYGGTHKGLDWHRGNETSCYEDSGNYTTDLVVTEAVKYLEARAQEPTKPFFLYLPFHLIHAPNQVPQQFLDLYPKMDLKKTAREQGMCGVCACANRGTGSRDVTWESCRTVLAMASALDWAVGRVVDALRSSDLYNNTLIVYTSDNGAQGGQGGTSYPLRGFKTYLYDGGMRVPGFFSGGSPVLPAAVRGATNHKLYHVTDLLPTLVRVAGGDVKRNRPLDGVDVWESIIDASTPSPRTEILHNINPACGDGFVKPNAALRVGDWKILVECFNTSTLKPTDMKSIELYNMISDPYEAHNLASAQPTKVKELLARMAQFGSSPDQVPPTLFYPFNQHYHGVRPWNYQCPQCPHGDALPGPKGYHYEPWCDDVVCGSGPPPPPPSPPAPPPAPPPSPACPWHMQNGGLGGSKNPDIDVFHAVGWEDCCAQCIKHSGCGGWTFYTDGSDSCHLHANAMDQNPTKLERITGYPQK